MTKEDMFKLVLSGRPVLLVEYRATETDSVNRKVVKAGESATMPVVKHKVLVGNDSWEVTEFLPDGADLNAAKKPPHGAVMRDLLVVEVRSMEKTKWGSRIDGDFLGKLDK